jgi:hypothetical protein
MQGSVLGFPTQERLLPNPRAGPVSQKAHMMNTTRDEHT